MCNLIDPVKFLRTLVIALLILSQCLHPALSNYMVYLDNIHLISNTDQLGQFMDCPLVG